MRDLLSVLLILSISIPALSCRDRVFDNPFDPGRSDTAYEISRVLNLDFIAPLDLSFSPEALWICDGGNQISAVDYNSGQTIRTLNPGRPVIGITHAEGDLWLAFPGTRQLNRVNALNGETVRQLFLPRGEPGRLDYHQGRLYVADSGANVVMVVDPLSGNVERTLNHLGFSLDGLAYDGYFTWTLDSGQEKIFRQADNGTPGQAYVAPARNLSGLAWGADSLWCGDRGGRIFRLRFQ